MPWRTIEGETIAPAKLTPLEVLLRGVFDRRRFLALIRHFVVFEDDGGNGVVKKLAGYHQFHAVNIAVKETIRAAGGGAMALKEEGGYFAGGEAGGQAGGCCLAHAGFGQIADDGILRRAAWWSSRTCKTQRWLC